MILTEYYYYCLFVLTILYKESCFQAMREFESQKLLPGESPHVFLFHLKSLLNRALPALTGEAK